MVSPDMLTMRNICARFGVERWTVHRWMRDLGFPKGSRPKGTRERLWNEAEIARWEQKANIEQSVRPAPVPLSVEALNHPRLQFEAIQATRHVLPKINLNVGIYFLFDGDTVVYVGQSIVNMGGRVFQHMGDKTFDAFAVIECTAEQVDFLEAYYIFKLKPKYNKRNRSGYATRFALSKLLAALGDA